MPIYSSDYEPWRAAIMKNRRGNTRIILGEKMNAVITYNDTLKYAHRCCVCDVSQQGMFVETETILDKDAYVNLKVHSEELLGKPMWIQGVVVRTQRNGMAIEFSYTNDEDIITLLTSSLYR
jgi:adenosylmethionine-8-amino-7-oxononanoate aminotransferase